MNKASLNATITKIRAMHGRMLTGEDYRILSSKGSVAEVAQYLKDHEGFKDTFADIDVNTVHRGYIEELLKKRSFEIYLKLRDFQHLGKKQFYDLVSERYENELLLIFIRTLNSGEKNSFLNSLPTYFAKSSSIDFYELAACKNVEEFARKLEHTKYSPLCELIVKESKQGDMTEVENAFAQLYYKRLLGSIEKDLSKSDAKLIMEPVKAGVHIRNFVNAYRMKAYFNAPPDEISKKMVTVLGSVGSHGMNRLFECDSEQEMLELFCRLRGTKGVVKENSKFLETAMTQVKLNYARKLMRTQSMPAVYFAFLQLCDIETSNIIHIIEGIRYGLEPDKIEALIAY